MLTLYRSLLPAYGNRWLPACDCAEPAAETPESEAWCPRVDVVRENGHFKLTAEFPGVDKDDIHVDVKDGYLTVRGEKKRDHSEEKDGYSYSERFYGSFERSFRLPRDASVDDIKAKLENGVLTLTVPVTAKEPTQIEVKAE